MLQPSLCLVNTLVVLGITFASSELYTLDWGPPASNSFPFAKFQKLDRQGRSLRTLAGDEPFCEVVADKFRCIADTTVQEEAIQEGNVTSGPFTEISVKVLCDFDSNIGFDFRKSSNCKCEASIERIIDGADIEMPELNPPKKVCPCLICAEGFGDVPVSIDCSFWENVTMEEYVSTNDLSLVDESGATVEPVMPDSLITSECSSLDCGMGCNGTCRLDCASSDVSCEFCSANQPTQAPGNSANGGDLDENDPMRDISGVAPRVGNVGVCSMIIAIVFAACTINLK